MIYGKGKSFMEKLVPFFEKADSIGGMTMEIQQEIFHSLAERYSCIPLEGTKSRNAKKPKPEATGWKGWCNQYPNKKLELKDYNTDMIGLCTIPYNNLFVLDVDDNDTFQKVVSYFNLVLPETTIVQTGKGYHYYYLYPVDNVKYTERSKIHLGFDIRASLYVVAPGSSHPNGSYYKLLNLVKPLVETPEWLKEVSSNNGFINFILCHLNEIRCKEIQEATKNNQLKPGFNIDNLIAKFLKQYPEYEKFMNEFPGYTKSFEVNMSKSTTNYNPFEVTQKPEIEIPTNTQNLLNQSPPVQYRSEPIMAAITALINSGLSNEQVKELMLSSPLGNKLIQKGPQFTDREIASANAFIQANPPKKQKINIEHEAYSIMLHMDYVKNSEGDLYCKVIQSPNRTEFINVKSDSFYGIICKQLYSKFKKSIVSTKYKSLLTMLIEEKRLTAPIVPTMNRFYQKDMRLIYDLGRDDYQCIEITPNKVVQIPQPDMILERSDLSNPVEHIDLLSNTISEMDNFWNICGINEGYKRHYLNILILSYLFEKINSPVLYLYGQQGSGKTHLALAIKNIFDPLEAGAVASTKLDNFRLFLSKSGIGFMDNFSILPKDFLNDLCNSYSGGIVFSRQLFSDKKGIKYSIRCPMILASVKISPKLPEDFISRTIFLKVNHKRNLITETELKDKLNKLYPKIRGLLFNLASQILPIMNTYKPTNLTRHADLDLLGQAYCDIVKTSLKYETIIQKINLDSAFSIIDDEAAIRKFVEIVTERKFITFTMSEMSRMISEDDNFRINDSQLGKDLKYYGTVLNQLHIKLYPGYKLYNGARPYVAFIDGMKNIPENIDCYKLQVSPEYITEIYLRFHKTEIGQVIDDMINSD